MNCCIYNKCDTISTKHTSYNKLYCVYYIIYCVVKYVYTAMHDKYTESKSVLTFRLFQKNEMHDFVNDCYSVWFQCGKSKETLPIYFAILLFDWNSFKNYYLTWTKVSGFFAIEKKKKKKRELFRMVTREMAKWHKVSVSRKNLAVSL